VAASWPLLCPTLDAGTAFSSFVYSFDIQADLLLYPAVVSLASQFHHSALSLLHVYPMVMESRNTLCTPPNDNIRSSL
ncbi:MAG: hypothetical protein KAY67_03200, partial [Aeromonadaceae bacterium]|nr:hypothetical protein [Aeromonadaceae bacterium]